MTNELVLDTIEDYVVLEESVDNGELEHLNLMFALESFSKEDLPNCLAGYLSKVKYNGFVTIKFHSYTSLLYLAQSRDISQDEFLGIVKRINTFIDNIELNKLLDKYGYAPVETSIDGCVYTYKAKRVMQ